MSTCPNQLWRQHYRFVAPSGHLCRSHLERREASGPASPAVDQGRADCAGYDKYRRAFSKLIWQLASPKWQFEDATFDRSAAAFDNPDHVAIVIHNYRWRLGLAEGENMTTSKSGWRNPR